MTTTAILVAALALAAGTFMLRVAGTVLRARVELSPRAQAVLTAGVAALFVALVVTSALLDGQDLAGWARPAGVAVGGVLAWRGAPFVVVVTAAALVAAVLRSLGVS